MGEALFTHRLGTLRPVDDAGRELLHGLTTDEMIRVKITRPRNLKFHRLFWGLMSMVHENLPDEKRERYPTTELLVAWIKVATGHCDAFEVEGRGTVYIPKSISFAKMDAAEFSAFFNRCCDLVAKHFIPNITADQWRKEVASMIGMAA